jgi:hypothetical protein
VSQYQSINGSEFDCLLAAVGVYFGGTVVLLGLTHHYAIDDVREGKGLVLDRIVEQELASTHGDIEGLPLTSAG